MIDMHTHILPKMDDGSQNTEQSHAMIALLQQQGITAVAVTPHFYPNRETPDSFLKRRLQAIQRLGDPELPCLYGAEVAYFSGISNCQELPQLQLGDTGLLLVEMPFRRWTDRIIQDICNIPIRHGLTPVLAHVDRYRARGQFPKYWEHLLEWGVLFQCNADVFETFSGRHWAIKQIKRGRIHFLGSDCHNLAERRPNLDLARQVITKKLGDSAWEQLAQQARQQLHL